ncbi:MOSC domain-containing protein YiiM [Pseudomonas duriflava]|uniref:MOSC domain-containing protein YiiM n=1 Tax=Pseudomonas duriflava TaxID=459528 RepID=A0A562QCA5_9PSED|nr:MOSC domain-containing protein [Pseudomonas duriflava]TWI54343.1 MOSC domain-containing protein YiiM [Pseudomonas duriflava]
MIPLKELLAAVPQQGVVQWIGVRPALRADMIVVEEVEARREAGLTGDHARPSPRNSRQVTFIQWEHLAVVSALIGRPLEPQDLRRNIAVSGINLFSLKNRQFQIGDALFETTGWCQPCSRLEERLGKGTFQAMRGHGGITARALNGGVIRLGDSLTVVE